MNYSYFLTIICHGNAQHRPYLCPNTRLRSGEHLFRRRPPVLPLTCSDIKGVSRPLQESLDSRERGSVREKGPNKDIWKTDLLFVCTDNLLSMPPSICRIKRSYIAVWLERLIFMRIKLNVTRTLILASSGPFVDSWILLPCFSLCLYVFMTPQRKALLFYTNTHIQNICKSIITYCFHSTITLKGSNPSLLS